MSTNVRHQSDKDSIAYTNDSDEGQVASGAPEPLPTIISDNEDSELHKTLAVSKGKPLDNDVINISSPSLDLSMQHHSSAGNKWKQLAKEPACSMKKLKLQERWLPTRGRQEKEDGAGKT